MTRSEVTGIRDLTFSGWVKKNLPDSSTGFMVSDLDFIMYNYKTKDMMLIEIKTRKAKMKTWQRKLFELIDDALKKGLAEDYLYHGFHCIRFENTGFEDGRVIFDNKLSNEQEIKDILSFNANNVT